MLPCFCFFLFYFFSSFLPLPSSCSPSFLPLTAILLFLYLYLYVCECVCQAIAYASLSFSPSSLGPPAALFPFLSFLTCSRFDAMQEICCFFFALFLFSAVSFALVTLICWHCHCRYTVSPASHPPSASPSPSRSPFLHCSIIARSVRSCYF